MDNLFSDLKKLLESAILIGFKFLCLGVIIQLLIDDKIMGWDPVGNIQDAGSSFIGRSAGGNQVGIDGFSGIEIESHTAGGNYSQDLKFWSHHTFNDDPHEPKMILKHDGNVGIGTINPEATLDVVGSIKASGNVTIGGNLNVTGTTATVSNDSTFTGNVNIANYLIYQRESIASTASSFTLNNQKIISEITIDTDNSNGTLDNGHTYGQIKRVIIVYVDGTKTFRLNITNFVHGSYIEFYNIGQSAELIWTQSRTSGINDAWCLVGGSGGLVVA